MTIYTPSFRHSVQRKLNLRPNVRGRDYGKGETLFRTHTPSKVERLFDKIGNIASRKRDALSLLHDTEPSSKVYRIFTDEEAYDLLEEAALK
jgi:hypothetical protein